jgi:LytS/YehU family sensor histidine kinase
MLAVVIFPQNWQEWMSGKRAIGFHSLNALIYSFVLIGTQMLQYYRLGLVRERDAQKAEMRNLMLEKDLSQARIDTLRIQINPHFLFNALNSISSLISTSNGPEAIRMTGLLGSLLRAALEQTRTCFIPLSEELEFLEKYIEIEKIRFGERLQMNQSVPRSCLDRPVPSLVLQPIVENVVKHAVSPTMDPVVVNLKVVCNGKFMTFEVSDNGPGVAEQTIFGCGLFNISERLRLLYGTSAAISITNNSSGGALVRLTVPVSKSRQSISGPEEKETRPPAN